MNRQNLTTEEHFFVKKETEINMLTRQSLQTIYQRKTQFRQKLGLQEGENIAEKLG